MSKLDRILKDYEQRFNDVPPPLDAAFTDDEMFRFLADCICSDKNPRTMDEHDLLELQYKIKFPNDEEIPLMMVHMTEDEWRLTMRKCLRSGKPYELPDDIKKLMEEGAVF